MILLYRTLTDKPLHRSSVYLDVIVHDVTINSLNEYQKSFISYLSNSVIDTTVEITMDKFKYKDEFLQYSRCEKYWRNVFESLPKVKLDNRIKLGTYSLPDFKSLTTAFLNLNLRIIVRSSKRYTNQIIEIINNEY